jgi:hypothetical protein
VCGENDEYLFSTPHHTPKRFFYYYFIWCDIGINNFFSNKSPMHARAREEDALCCEGGLFIEYIKVRVGSRSVSEQERERAGVGASSLFM